MFYQHNFTITATITLSSASLYSSSAAAATSNITHHNKPCGWPPKYAYAPYKLTFDLLTLKVMSESRVTWPTSVPILVFLGLSVLDSGPMYATNRQKTDAHHRLMPLPRGGA